MIELHCGDFRDLIRDLPDDWVDLIITDPPYPKEYRPLWSDLSRESARVLKPGGFLVSLSGHHGLPEIYHRLCEHLRYYWQGALIHTGPVALRYEVKMFNRSKPIHFFYKPPRGWPRRCLSDTVFGGGRAKEHHRWEQAVEESIELIDAFTKPGDLILDPFCGSGTNLVAALRTGRRAIGYDVDPEACERAVERIDREYQQLLRRVA